MTTYRPRTPVHGIRLQIPSSPVLLLTPEKNAKGARERLRKVIPLRRCHCRLAGAARKSKPQRSNIPRRFNLGHTPHTRTQAADRASAAAAARARAAYLARRRGDPKQALQVSSTRCRVHRDDALYQATEDQQGLIPWNGKQDVLIDRFDGRALLDFIRDSSSRPFRVQEKSEEEEELEEFVNFERYRDLIKHRRRGFSDEAGLQHVVQELEAKALLPFSFDKPQSSQPPASKGAYSQVGYSYKGEGNEESEDLDSDDDDEKEEDEDDDKDFSSDDSSDERMENIAKEFGIKRYNWMMTRTSVVDDGALELLVNLFVIYCETCDICDIYIYMTFVIYM
ncbi:uncharacterized protein [Miscanthus floridulus]|uniref:uncharacterized protein n=1 Tax=Miscanthus floridulus TaxID=154761 RepID=UPI00345A8CD4